MANDDSNKKRDDSWGPDTRWTTIINAANGANPETVNAAWRILLERYREPVRASLRRRAGPCDIDELFDAFFSYVFEHRALARADKNRGKFRCFLQGVIKNFIHETHRARAKQTTDIDDIPVAAPAETPAAEREEETAWAMNFLGQALVELQKKMPRDAKILMESYGIGGAALKTSSELAKEHGLNENAIFQARSRAKRQLTTFLNIVVAPTTDSPEDAFDEISLITDRLIQAFPGLCE